jgi:hypothetical protein
MNRRAFLRAGVAAGAYSRAAVSLQARGDWFRKSPRVFLLDFQMPDPADQGVPGMPRLFEKLDPEKIVDQVAAANAKVLLVHAKCNQGNAYYNTRVGHKHSALGKRDLMADFSRLCRARGLTLLYYVQLGRERRSFTYPERRARDAEGRGVIRVDNNPLLAAREEKPVVCLNGPHREYIKDILGELSANYDFDGYWLDGFGWWGRLPVCYCDTCKTSYRRDTGRELPRGALASEEGRAYLRWRQALNTRIIHELTDHIHSINAKLTVTHNGSGISAWANWEFCDRDDYTSHEFHFNEGMDRLSLLCSQQWALRPGVPFEIELWRFANRLGGSRSTARGYQTRPPDVLLTEMAAVVARGGFPQYYDQLRPDGTLEDRSLAVLKPVFAQVAERQSWGGQGRPVPYALILWSKATEAMAPGKVSQSHWNGLRGSHRALVEAHVPVGVISERDTAAGRWRGARVIILPSVECLPDDCVAALTDFVRNGGGIVATGRASLADGDGVRRKNFALADLLGADYQGMTEKLYSFVNLEKQHPVCADLPLEFPMTVYETLQAKVTARDGVETLGTIIDPMPGFHMGYPPNRRTGSPALVVRRFGEGCAVYVSAALGEVYERFCHPDNRRLLVNAVTWAAGRKPPVSADAPETVEIVPWRDERGRRTIIHLVNRTGAGLSQGEGAFMHEAIPVHNIKLHLARELGGRTAKAQPGNRPLPVETQGDRMSISVERLDVWEIVEVR